MARKIAIVGGGCAGVAAAWELSADPRFEVTLYQEGWRLGGKGASGRGVHGRIEEHGLHLWLGYYENAFRTVREAYRHLASRGFDIPGFEDAFEPLPLVGVWAGDRPWLAAFPREDGEPGDGVPLAAPGDVAWMAPRVARLLSHLVASLAPAGEGELWAALADLADGLAPTGLIAASAPPATQFLPRFLLLRELARPVLETAALMGPQPRTLAESVDVILAAAIGYFQARLDPDWYASLNRLDFREWLTGQGLALPGSTGTPLLTALYNLAFAYESGDPSRPRIAAGVGLECAVRTFLTYKGAPFWRMKAGMGDAVFAPLYLALKDRGVDVRFFHRLRAVTLASRPARDGDGNLAQPGRVASLAFDVQAEMRDGRPYEPLSRVRDFPAWPAEPFAEQLAGPRRDATAYENPDITLAARQVELRAGEDFHHVILALGAEPSLRLLGELVDSDPAWRATAAGSRTVATQALQLWLKPATRDLGWKHGPAAVTGFATGLDTWAEMSHLAPQEDWPDPPGSIAYFCGSVWERPGADVREVARADAEQLLAGAVSRILPGLTGWRTVSGKGAPADGTGVLVPDGYFARLNHRGSERYSQSLPGTIESRISPFDRSVENLSVAGDWTDCGLNVGCVEAAVSSGIMAAAAASGTVDAARLQGHGYVRRWFETPARPAVGPLATSPRDASLLALDAELREAVDAELDSLDEGLLDAAMWAANPWRPAAWWSDAVPLIQAAAAPGEVLRLDTGIRVSSRHEADAFRADWLAPGASRGAARVSTDAGGTLHLAIEMRANAAEPGGLLHLLLRAPNGQAAALVEIRVDGR